MMFLVRSAFWLSLVYAHMPFDEGAALRVVDQTQSAILGGAASAAAAKCAQDKASCRAILSAAAGLILAPKIEGSSQARGAPRAGGKGKGVQPSANSLSAAD